MKIKRIFILLVVFFLVSCLKPNSTIDSESTIKDVKKYINEVGVENINWDTFESASHSDEGSGLIVEVYKFKDGKLELIGFSYDEKPMKIILISGDSEEILKESEIFDNNN